MSRRLPPLRFTADGLRSGMRDLLAHVAKHLFTAADGETYAIGRLLGVLLLIWGLAGPTGLAVYLLIWNEPRPSFDDWVAFINVMCLYLPALSASVVGLITLTIPAERSESDRLERERIRTGDDRGGRDRDRPDRRRGPDRDGGGRDDCDDGSAAPLT